MNLLIKKSFLKDIKKINNPNLNKQIKLLFETVEKISSINDISNIKKMKGYDTFYRIRIGKFRVGIKYEDDTIIFIRVLPRKDIYKYFP